MKRRGRVVGQHASSSGTALVVKPSSKQHVPRYPAAWGEGGQVRKLRMEEATGALHGSEPFLLMPAPTSDVSQPRSGSSTSADSLLGGSVDALLTAMLQGPPRESGAPPQPVMAEAVCARGPWGRIIHLDASKNEPGSPYHVRWPECKPLPAMPLRDLLQCIDAWSTSKLAATLDVATVAQQQQHHHPQHNRQQAAPRWAAHAVPGSSSSAACCSDPRGLAALSSLAALLRALLDAASAASAPHVPGSDGVGDDDWLAELGINTALPAVPIAHVQLDLASAGAVLPLKYEPHGCGQLVVQASGRAHVLLVPPEHALGGRLAPFAAAHPYDTYSAVGIAATACAVRDDSVAAAAAELWPGMVEVRGRTCIMCPDDVLYVPPYWSVHSELLNDEASGSLSNSTTIGRGAPAAAAAAAGSRAPRSSTRVNASLRVTLAYPGGDIGDSYVPSPGAVLLKAARCVEAWVATETGAAGARALLLAQAQVMSAERVAAARWVRACLAELGAPPPWEEVEVLAGNKPRGEQDCVDRAQSQETTVGADGEGREEDGHKCTCTCSANCRPAHWLPSLLARQHELRLLTPPGDMRDYRLARLAQEVADAASVATAPGPCAQLAALLAGSGKGAGRAHSGWTGASAQLLASMCDGRLLPTPWLDAYGQGDPGVPRATRLEYAYAAPRLTREEAAFPELFRAVIAGKEEAAAREAAVEHLARLSLPLSGGEGQAMVAVLPPVAE